MISKTKMYNFSDFQHKKSFMILMRVIIAAQDIKKAKTIFLDMPNNISQKIRQENLEYILRIMISQISEAGKILETFENIINKHEVNQFKKKEKIDLNDYNDINFIITSQIKNKKYENESLYENNDIEYNKNPKYISAPFYEIALKKYKENREYIKNVRDKITFHYDNYNEVIMKAVAEIDEKLFMISRSDDVHDWNLGPGCKIITHLMTKEFVKEETRDFTEIINSIQEFSESFLIFSGEFVWDYFLYFKS
jgi:hypothetical protein